MKTEEVLEDLLEQQRARLLALRRARRRSLFEAIDRRAVRGVMCDLREQQLDALRAEQVAWRGLLRGRVTR